jgi:hypothetical protein
MSEHVRRIDSFQTKLLHSRFAEAIAKERWQCAREELKALNDQRCCAECVQLRRFGRALTSVEAELDTANNSTSDKFPPLATVVLITMAWMRQMSTTRLLMLTMLTPTLMMRTLTTTN